MELISLGGPVVVVLIVISIIGLTIVLYKLLQLRHYSRGKLEGARKAVDAWVTGDRESARESLERQKTPVAELLCNGMSLLSTSGERKDVVEQQVREELTRQGQQIVSRVNAMNSFIELIAYLSPMMGLLGTVLGMIDVFYGLANEGGGSDAGVLAGGIWEALLTTAVGLTVAIPFAVIHAMLESKATGVREVMEDQLTRLFTANLAVR